MKKKLILLLCFFCVTCGLPDTSSFQEIQAPVIIDDGIQYPYCQVNGGSIAITLELMVYNPEMDFSGYNVYLDPNTTSFIQVQSDLMAEAQVHIYSNNGINQFDKTTEANFIIQSSHNTIPTLQKGDIKNIDGTTPSTYTTQPTYISVTVNTYPQNVNSGGALPAGTSFGFGVTGTSIPNVTESVLSNIIIISATNTTGYCPTSYQSVLNKNNYISFIKRGIHFNTKSVLP